MTGPSMLRSPHRFVALALAGCLVLATTGSAETSTTGLCFRGLNLSGAEYGDVHGKEGTNFTYPSDKTQAYFADKGFDTVRLPFRWERLQPELGQAFDPVELARLRKAVDQLRTRGFSVILDPHNFGYYGELQLTSKALPARLFANFWARLAVEFANEDGVVFGLMNEPHDIGVQAWLKAANQAIAAIRAAKAKNLILVPGTHWSGVSSWQTDFDGGSNAEVMLAIKDSGNNHAYEVHQYFDEDFSGTHAACTRVEDAKQAFVRMTGWMKAHGVRGFLGEFGGSSQPACLAAIGDVVRHLEDNADVWLGWTYWAGGDWWPASEALNIQPTGDGDRPQLKALTAAMGPSGNAAGACTKIR